MLHRLFSTDRSATLLFHRVALGAVLLPHGLQKLLGWWGGPGVDGTIASFGGHLGVPAPLAILVIVAESLGAVALIAGAGSRLAAAGAAATMIGAIALVHAPHGFFMNWTGAQAGEGFELHLLAIALAIPLAIRGGGRWSIDGALAAALRRRRAPAAPRALGLAA